LGYNFSFKKLSFKFFYPKFPHHFNAFVPNLPPFIPPRGGTYLLTPPSCLALPKWLREGEGGRVLIAIGSEGGLPVKSGRHITPYMGQGN